jgi:hypothetical protein
MGNIIELDNNQKVTKYDDNDVETLIVRAIEIDRKNRDVSNYRSNDEIKGISESSSNLRFSMIGVIIAFSMTVLYFSFVKIMDTQQYSMQVVRDVAIYGDDAEAHTHSLAVLHNYQGDDNEW